MWAQGRPAARVVDADKRRAVLARHTEGHSLREISRDVGVSLAVVHAEVKASQGGGVSEPSPAQLSSRSERIARTAEPTWESQRMASVAETRKSTGQRAELAVVSALEELGFVVTNLNDLVGNCPFADLLARRDATVGAGQRDSD